MNIALWVVQGLLAVAFGMAGSFKASKPREELKGNLPWVNDFSDNQVKIIGVLEVLAAIGLILPWATGILPWLTPLAAVGLVLTMIGAMVVHARRGENSAIGINAVLLLLSAFVAYGRF